MVDEDLFLQTQWTTECTFPIILWMVTFVTSSATISALLGTFQQT